MKRLSLISAALLMSGLLWAQRTTDALNRGLVATYIDYGVYAGQSFLSWRMLPEEYYDVSYNVYRNGTKINAEPLRVTNCLDPRGSASAQYTIRPVVRGVEQAACAAVTPWTTYDYEANNWSTGTQRTYAGYRDITLARIYSKANGADITYQYEPNDACCADLDGDGEVEILIKRLNTYDASVDASAGRPYLYMPTATDFAIIEAYKLDGTRLWWIDCGPNMVSLNSTEINAVAFDWDGDGRAEVVLRGADGMVLHKADGTTQVIGNAALNYRHEFAGNTAAQWAWTRSGVEYLLYLNGATGAPYQVMEYPLKRLENGETDLKAAWGDNYGHRAAKYFFGAPFLDGRRPSIFLARGIYTRHKMVAYDVDPASHRLIERWRWNCNTPGSPWYGQGNHNFVVADVDWDGRDEIVFGSMTIDDNGQGLSTTGLGHGDAMHVRDFNPYVHGQEVFACNEEKPANNYRSGTTSEIYYRTVASGDDGRALMGNFSNDYIGAQGRSVSSGFISSVTNAEIAGITAPNSFIEWGDLNFRIYWDGDLLDEILDSPGIGRQANINKPGFGRLFTSNEGNMNNDSKNNPCFQGDILGDWREEIIIRVGTNIRLYTSAIPTAYALPTLWSDHQYRQAAVWQMCGYNQPPHVSYFLGEAEGITVAPPPLTQTGRTELTAGASITTAHNDKHLLLAETRDMSIQVAQGAAPYILTVNAPTWVQGRNDNAAIVTTTYTHTLVGGAFAGGMRLVKQGDGRLVLPAVTQTYTGETNVWAGTLSFDGQMQGSRVWLNRFGRLESNGGRFLQPITMDYAARLILGMRGVTASHITMNFGSRIVFTLQPDVTAGVVTVDTLTLNTVNWSGGPAYRTPVFAFQGSFVSGRYHIATINKQLRGNLSDVALDGFAGIAGSFRLEQDGNRIYLVVERQQQDGRIWDFTQGWDVTASQLTTGGLGWSYVNTKGLMPGYIVQQQLSNAELACGSVVIRKTQGLRFTTNNRSNRLGVSASLDRLVVNTGTVIRIPNLSVGDVIVIRANKSSSTSTVTLTGTGVDVTGAVPIARGEEPYSFVARTNGDVTFRVDGIYLVVGSIEVRRPEDPCATSPLAGKADLDALSSEEAQVTGIDEVEEDGDTSVFYDLQGRPVDRPVKGRFYLIRGKRVVFR